MAVAYSPKVPTEGLVLSLDVSNPKSYPGSGTTWYDLSGNNYRHTLSGNLLTTAGGVQCFDVSTSGWIDRTSTSYTFGTSYTMMSWARPLADSAVATWRTLFRTQPDDHPLLIQDATNLIGYYDNNAGGFISYGINAGTIGIENVWTLFTIVGTNNSITLHINDSRYSGTIYGYTASGNTHYTIGSTSGSGQPFGYVATTQLYNRALSVAEIKQAFNASRSKYGV